MPEASGALCLRVLNHFASSLRANRELPKNAGCGGFKSYERFKTILADKLSGPLMFPHSILHGPYLPSDTQATLAAFLAESCRDS